MEIKDKLHWKIQRWCKHELPYLHLTLYRGFSNLFIYFKVIWNDRDWDHDFLFTLLKFKINKMTKYHESRDRYVNCSYNVSKMKLCVTLIDKIQSDYYEHEYQNYYECKYNFLDFNKEKSKKLKTTEIKNNLEEYFKKYPNDYKKALKEFEYEDKKDLSYALIMGMIRQNKAKNLLFELIKQNIFHWWD